MASFVGKFVAKKILKEGAANKFGTEDPMFEYVPVERQDGSLDPKKVKKVHRAIPPGLSKNDEKVLVKVRRRAYRLDQALFGFMGIRFGWSSVIGIIPAIGDVLDMLLALMVMKTCMKVDGGLPPAVKAKMMMNVILDFVVGIIPFLGDIVDAAFKANTRNALELEKYLRAKGKKELRQSKLPIPTDYSEPAQWDEDQAQGSNHSSNLPSRQQTVELRQQSTNGHRSNGNGNGNGNGNESVERPAPAQMRENRSGLGSFLGGRSRPDDLEMGRAPSGNGAGRNQRQ